MDERPAGTPIDDIAYLARSDHRAPTLIALTVRPRSRSELWEITGVSESTIRRTLSEFDDRNWITRDGYQYEVTQLGGFVASAMADLIDRFETERELRDVWQYLPGEEDGFTIELCADATVSIAEPDNPYRPVNRFLALLDETEEFRFSGFDVALLEPCKDELCQRTVNGMQAELVTPSRVAEYVRANCPDLVAEALGSGNLDIRLHDALPPYGVGILDDRIAISGYDPEGVTVRVLVDTDAPAAHEWAESTYTTHRRTTPTLPIETDLE